MDLTGILELLVIALSWGITIAVGLVTALVIYARWYYGTLENTPGLTGVVEPYFVGGSNPYTYQEVICLKDKENAREYGPIYGYYEGREPQIFISDPDLIRLIFIKDFDSFPNKRAVDFGHELINEMMDILPYEKWNVVRSHLSPQLTTGKIKSMNIQMLEAISDWSERMKKKAAGNDGSYEFVPKQAYMALTTDVIARCVFATKINASENPDNEFVKYLKRIALEDEEMGPESVIMATFPFVINMAFKLSLTSNPFLPPEVMNYFGNLLKSILKARKQSGSGRLQDFVDVLLEMTEKCETDEFKRLGITETTVLSQGLIFLIAGFDTTATTLTVLSYQLAEHPEIQTKLLQEIDEYMGRNNGTIKHETLGELVYMNACIFETLRISPPIIRLERVCEKDWHHEPTGLEIKKGVIVQVSNYAMHFNEKYFPEPETFRPERFLPENKDKLVPYTFSAFGHGPHNCIGARFAKEEIQMAVVSILKDFRFELSKDSHLQMLPGRIFLTNFEPFHLKICKRV